MNNCKLLAVAGAMLAVACVSAMADAGGKTARKDVIWPAEAIKWADGPVAGTHVAPLWGDMNKGGDYGVLLKFDAGLMHPLHWHDNDLKIVVLSGTFVHTPEGGMETKLGPGSYLLQLGKGKHVSGCAAGAGCEFLMTSSGKFDMTMVEKTSAEKK